MKRALGGLGLGLALIFLSTATAQAAPADSPGSSPSANSGLGGVGDLVGGLAGGAGTLGFLLPSPNGSGANFVTGLMNNPAGAITGTPDSILPYGLLDGGKPQPLPSK
ncbi:MULTISPECIES: hypothetical protein [Amycolatopsis]|uniref:Secreted protein n=1 Tax=Amycolatopsis albidoflavus TaxID=102226 RepID=A0ABW5ID35_9PSEU